MGPSDIDLVSVDSYRAGIPYAVFERLRREDPVHWHEEVNGSGFWAVTRYRDVSTVLRDPATYSSNHTNLLEDCPAGDPRGSPEVLINMDPPKHSRHRAMLNKSFSPREMQRKEPHIRELLNRMIDKVAPRGECEFIEELAGNLPLQVLIELLGIPPGDRDRVFEYSLRMLRLQDPQYATTPEEGVAMMQSFLGYALELANQRRAAPGDDMLSQLMHAEVDGARLAPQDFGMLFALLLAAGHETTRNLIANGMLALIEHPAERQRLIEDPTLIPGAVEEMLRFAPPVIHFRRTATRDAELAGRKIAAGDKVVVWFPSANRDESIFPRADTFDVGRAPNEHLSFGQGAHFCLGAALGRLQARIAFEELLRRLPDLELAGPVVRLESNFLNGLKRMPVRFTPRA